MRGTARTTLIALCLAALAFAAGCGSGSSTSTSGSSTTASSGASGSLGPNATVKVGLGPYYDYQLFRAAQDLGVAKKAGLDLKFVDFPTPPLEQLRRGDIDVAYGCHTCAFSVLKNFPTYRNFMISNQFKGYVLVGKKGKVKPYSEYLKESGGNLAQAKKNFVQNELIGKTFALVKKDHISTIAGLLKQGGASVKDIKVLDFADEGKAANAFITGDADFYSGALPQQARLLYGSDLKGKFVNAAPQQAFGPGKEGELFFSTFNATSDWLAKHHDEALRLLAVWYRTERYLKERPDTVLPIVSKAVASSTGGVLPNDITKAVMTKLNYFPTLDEAKTFFTPSSSLYWANSVKRQADLSKAAGQFPENIDPLKFDVEEQMYNELLKNKKLVDFINAPLQ